MKIVIFVNLVTKHVKISYIIISSNFTPHIRLTLILSLFTLCIGKVKIMLISLKCHVLSPQNAYSFTIFFLSKLKYFGNILYYLWVLKACLGMLGNVLGRPRHALQRPRHALQHPRRAWQCPWPT